jgi:hypothetical protein
MTARNLSAPIACAEPLVRSRTTPEGCELGANLARLCDEAEPAARLIVPALPPRCQSCAFRAGRHLANGSPETQMDALKCVVEGIEFCCHQPDREGEPCSGWAMMMLARNPDDEFGKAPWPFTGGVE